MKKILYISFFCLLFCCIQPKQAQAQTVFNDTILFQIRSIDALDNAFRYIIQFETLDIGSGSTSAFTGIGVLSMCNCYCDSIWDAWPPPRDDTDSLLTGGIGILSYPSTMSATGGSGLFKSSSSGGKAKRTSWDNSNAQ